MGWLLSRAGGGRLEGPLRRVEAMWFGQGVDPAWARVAGVQVRDDLAEVLARQQEVVRAGHSGLPGRTGSR